MAWPDALSLQLGYAGFGMRFVTGEDGAGDPRRQLEIYRKDAAGLAAPLDLELPGRGAELDPARCNVAALSLARDSRSIVNAVTVETEQRRVEVSVVLAPGFTPAAGDETAANRGQFLRANLSTASGDVRRKYRCYVADEAGDGHWDAPRRAGRPGRWTSRPIFPATEKGQSTYVRRLRPGSNTLLSRDSEGPAAAGPARALARLPGAGPGSVGRDGNLAADRRRLGTARRSPGHPRDRGRPRVLADRRLHGSQPAGAQPDPPRDHQPGEPVEPQYPVHAPADHRDRGRPDAARRHVPARTASPTVFTVRRRVDARDHFRLEPIAAGSLYNPGSEPIIVRDDTAHRPGACPSAPGRPRVSAPGRQRDHSQPDHRVPRRRPGGPDQRPRHLVPDQYRHRQGESPVYPVIVGLTWDFTGERQATILELADRGPEAFAT